MWGRRFRLPGERSSPVAGPLTERTRQRPSSHAALQRASVEISPDLNRHDGQGTASITVEFVDSFLELMWPDSTVTVSPGLERAVEKFRNRMQWRSSDWRALELTFDSGQKAKFNDLRPDLPLL